MSQKDLYSRNAIHPCAKIKSEKVCIIETSRAGIVLLFYNTQASPYSPHKQVICVTKPSASKFTEM